jgi:hypothetical protein
MPAIYIFNTIFLTQAHATFLQQWATSNVVGLLVGHILKNNCKWYT